MIERLLNKAAAKFPDTPARILAAAVFISFSLRFILIFKYGNRLTLASDDLNYIQSAMLLLKRGIFTFFNKNEPTVFVMPLYPFFLSAIFAISGPLSAGLTIARLIQSVFGAADIVLAFMIAAWFFDRYAAALTALIMAFYLPAIVTSGYMLTENIFTTLLLLLVYLSLRFASSPQPLRFVLLGAVWTLAIMTRPTIAFYPAILFIYILINRKRWSAANIFRCGISMALVFVVMLVPWWVRNYKNYGAFIPLSAASGNPMLQGTYIGYVPEPGQTASYSEGKTTYERNRNEVEAAKKRIAQIFKENFFLYLKWYTIGKTGLLWGTVFYWRQFFNINWHYVIIYHDAILFGFLGLLVALIRDFRRYFLPFALMLSFNIVHCIYMAFDRYAYPLIPILAGFLAYFICETCKPFIRYLKPNIIRILTAGKTAYKSK